ncbi:MAG: mechanosensitive ion channel family protein [Bacillota bacterium]|nr:mechanosensitive ion channel family protein [Bacillota bacterium]
MGSLTALLGAPLDGLPLWRWLLAALVAAVVYALLHWGRRGTVRLLRRLRRPDPAGDFPALLAGLLERRSGAFAFALLALAAGSLLLSPSPRALSVVRAVTLAALWFQIGLWSDLVVRWWLARAFGAGRGPGELEPEAASVFSALALIGRVLLWVLVALLILGSLGVNVVALLAGLSIAGVAVAFAVQNVLGDLIASLAIVLDKPFVVGDLVAAGDFTGTVEAIGLRATRLRALTGEQLVIPNADLSRSRIRNYGRAGRRLVVQRYGVAFETPPEKLEALPDRLERALSSVPGIASCRVHLAGPAGGGFALEVAFTVPGGDAQSLLESRQKAALAVRRALAEEGVAPAAG